MLTEHTSIDDAQNRISEKKKKKKKKSIVLRSRNPGLDKSNAQSQENG
jgi:hypothetical protein